MSDTTTAETAKVDAGFVGLAYVSDEHPGISRKKRGGSFRYVGLDGNIIRDRSVLQRIRSIVIPPAWMDVWISPSAKGHIQATGRDDRGRKQYRYHPDFRAIRDGNKYEHIVVFGAALVKLRRQVNRDMSRHGLTRAKVIATVVYLLDATLIRVGNSSYARENGSFGLTTLRSDHVKIGGAALRFEFKGKSGKTWRLQMHDRRVARIVKSCQDLPGQDLFQYVDQTGARASIGSAHVNDYLRQTTGRDITAKDFRTWAGTVLAGTALRELEPFDTEATAKANVRAAIERVAARLGNTPTVCRKCYIHPAILDAYFNGALFSSPKRRAATKIREDRAAMKPEEVAIYHFLRHHLRHKTSRIVSDRRSRHPVSAPRSGPPQKVAA